MLNNSILESIQIKNIAGTKTYGMDQIHHNIFFQKQFKKEIKFILNIIRAIYGDFHAIDDKKNKCSTTRIHYWRGFEDFFTEKYSEVIVKTENYKRVEIQHLNENLVYFLFYDHELQYKMLPVNKDNKSDYENLSKEFDSFIDHARLVEIPLNRCFPDPEKITTDFKELRELVNKADDISKEEIVSTLDGVLYHLQNTPLDDTLGKYIAGRRLSGFNNRQLKEALNNIFGVTNDLIKRYFSDYGVKIRLETSARLDGKDDDETLINTPWFDIYKGHEKVSFYDLSLEERNILYIVVTIVTYRNICAYFIIDEVYTHLFPAMKTNIEFLISEQAENTIHLLTTSSSRTYYEKKNF